MAIRQRIGFAWLTTTATILVGTCSGSAWAQNAPLTPLPTPETEINSGVLASPKPYGDHGTRGPIGHQPIAFPDPRAPRPDPYTFWKSRIINTGGGYGGGTVVIIVGGSPCYVPTYYGYGYGGYWLDSSAYANFRLGGFQMGFGQQQYDYSSSGPLGGYAQQYPADYGRGSIRERSAANAQRMNEQRERREQAAREKARSSSEGDDSDYYLYRKQKPKTALDNDPALAEAVADIEATFRTGDISRMERHIIPTDSLTLQAKGKTRTPLAASAYLEMTRAALKEMKTIRYELDKVEPASNGAWMVYGTHILRTEDGKEKSFGVGFVLKKRGTVWVIAEVSADVK